VGQAFNQPVALQGVDQAGDVAGGHGKHKVWTGDELSDLGTGHAVAPTAQERLRVRRHLVAGQVKLRPTWVRCCPAALMVAQDPADRDR
jgi:hypothetical protein